MISAADETRTIGEAVREITETGALTMARRPEGIAPGFEYRDFPTRESFETCRAAFFRVAEKRGLEIEPEEAWQHSAFIFTQWAAWKMGPENGRIYPRPRVGVMFYGPCGAGKSALADYLRDAIRGIAGISIRRVNTAALIDKYNRGELSEYEAQGYSDSDIYLDDLGYETDGKRYGEKWGLDDFLKFRYEYAFRRHNCYTFATTNLNGLPEIEQRYGAHVASRCAEMFDFIKLEGNDRRSGIAQKRAEQIRRFFEGEDL